MKRFIEISSFFLAVLIMNAIIGITLLVCSPQRHEGHKETHNTVLTEYKGKTIEEIYIEPTGEGYRTVFVFTDGTQLYIWNYKYTPSINKEGF